MKGVPADYHARLAAIDATHWWAVGMVRVEVVLIGPWLERRPLAVFDAGCGTGGFLDAMAHVVPSARLAGGDLSAQAIELAQARVPQADLYVGNLTQVPFGDHTFDVVALNDVLQHVEESVVHESLRELHRVLRRDGALVVRTNGARRGRRERSDWRLYDEALLRAALTGAGFRVLRTTFANLACSVPAHLMGRGPAAPSSVGCGIPRAPGRLSNAVGQAAMALEGAVVRRGLRVPWGHTLLALAEPA